MRLTEIWDPSMYRAGDEYDPRSPDYAGVEVDPEYEEYPTQFKWYVYDAEDNETEVVVSGVVEVVTEYADYFPTRRGRYHEDDDGPEGQNGVSKLTIKQVNVGGTAMTGQQAVAKFGKEPFVNYMAELVEAAVEGIVSKWGKVKITNWKMETELVFA